MNCSKPPLKFWSFFELITSCKYIFGVFGTHCKLYFYDPCFHRKDIYIYIYKSNHRDINDNINKVIKNMNCSKSHENFEVFLNS